PRHAPVPLVSSSKEYRRLAVLVASAAAIAALLALGLAGCGGGAAAAPDTGQPAEGRLQASQHGQLLSYVKDKVRARHAERVAQGNNEVAFVGVTTDVWLPQSGAIGAAPGAVAAATAVDVSGTTVQEAGVDEDDTIKTDGTLLATLSPLNNWQPGTPAARLAVNKLG